jgi:hypothetical protein
MALRGAVAEWLGRGLQSLVHQFESGRRLSRAQVSPPGRVCLYEVNPLREEREYAVREAARRERAAWSRLQEATRPETPDPTAVRTYGERWRDAAHRLVDALRALKN